MKARRMDYHLHTTHSMDGRQTAFQLVQRAAVLRLDEICITDHMDRGHPHPGVDSPIQYSNWLDDIAAARNAFPHIAIRAGIEIGDNPALRKEIVRELDALDLDFRLLSLHLVKGSDPYDPRHFDGITMAQAYDAYAEARLESVRHFADYDAVAHLGYVSKFAPYEASVRPFCHSHAPDVLDALLCHMAQEGKALEINTSGLNQTASPIPGGDLIKRFLALGGEFFTFGSDAHDSNHIYQNVEKCKTLARSLGARWQVGFDKRVMHVFRI